MLVVGDKILSGRNIVSHGDVLPRPLQPAGHGRGKRKCNIGRIVVDLISNLITACSRGRSEMVVSILSLHALS
jgi:hypothetical protein